MSNPSWASNEDLEQHMPQGNQPTDGANNSAPLVDRYTSPSPPPILDRASVALQDSSTGHKRSGSAGLTLSTSSDMLEPHQIGHFVMVNDDQTRAASLQNTVATLRSKLEERDVEYLRAAAPVVLTLATHCPFAGVRRAMRALLEELAALQLVDQRKALVSRWVPPNKLAPLDSKEPSLRGLFRRICASEGRLQNVYRVLGWHPSYLSRYQRTMQGVMRGTGPLPYEWRHYLAVLACARKACIPLLRFNEREFLAVGGEVAWIKDGVEALPAKLQALLPLNAMLAHQPWLITNDTMTQLLRGPNPEACWSLAELLHACVILTTFHSLSGVVWACGINPEPDLPPLDGDDDLSPWEEQASGSGGAGAVPDGVGLMTSKVIAMLKESKEEIISQREQWQDEQTDQKNAIWTQAEDESYSSSEEVSHQLAIDATKKKKSNEVDRYLGGVQMGHSDFDVTSKEYKKFLLEEFSWTQDGYAMVHQALDDLAPLLDDELRHVRSLTYNKWADKETSIDTSAFREAVWHYTHRLKGILDDAYNYGEVNIFLNRQAKFYIKKVVCFPQTITVNDFLNLGYDLKPDEKCHIAMLATEALKEGSLCYALSNISESLRNRNKTK